MVPPAAKTLGLIVVVFLYQLAGAGIFYFLESPSDAKRQQVAILAVRAIIDNLTCLSPEDITQLFSLGPDLRRASFSSVNGSLTVTPGPTAWDVPSALLFCTTVITTIGYGRLTPRTAVGQMLCVLYALFGIPLYLILLTRIGPKVAHLNENMVDRLLTLKLGTFKRHAIRFLMLLLTGTFFMLVVPSIIFTHTEGWTFRVAFYYSFITISTIGFGDYVAGANTETGWRILFTLWIPLGLSWFSSLISTAQDMLTEKIDCEPEDTCAPDQQAGGTEKGKVAPSTGENLCGKCGSHLPPASMTPVK